MAPGLGTGPIVKCVVCALFLLRSHAHNAYYRYGSNDDHAQPPKPDLASPQPRRAMKAIFTAKTLTVRHAKMMQEAIDAAQAKARTRTLSSYTGDEMLEAAREALRERRRYAAVTNPRILVKADCEAVPKSYKYGAEGTSASLVRETDPKTKEERWLRRTARVRPAGPLRRHRPHGRRPRPSRSARPKTRKRPAKPARSWQSAAGTSRVVRCGRTSKRTGAGGHERRPPIPTNRHRPGWQPTQDTTMPRTPKNLTLSAHARAWIEATDNASGYVEDLIAGAEAAFIGAHVHLSERFSRPAVMAVMDLLNGQDVHARHGPGRRDPLVAVGRARADAEMEPAGCKEWTRLQQMDTRTGEAFKVLSREFWNGRKMP